MQCFSYLRRASSARNIISWVGNSDKSSLDKLSDCAETLEMIREEVLRMSMDQMPVEMQILDELVAMMDDSKR